MSSASACDTCPYRLFVGQCISLADPPQAPEAQIQSPTHRVVRTLVCMPCSPVSSDNVVLGPIPAVQGGANVRGGLARSGEIWGRWKMRSASARCSPAGVVSVSLTGRPSHRTRPGLPARPAAAWPARRSIGVNHPNGTPAAIAWAITARTCRGLTANCASGGIHAARHRSGSPVQDWARTAARLLLHGWRRDDGQINPIWG